MLFRPAKHQCACGSPVSQVAKQCIACRKKRISVTCESCGTGFECVPSRVKRTCSRACADRLRAKASSDTQSKKVSIVCEHCGKQRMVSPAYSSRRFCSTGCSYTLRKKEKSSNWKGGITSERQSFFHRQNGLLYESLSGSEMQSVVADANRFTMKIKKCITFIILGVGQSSQNYEQILQTLFYCVSTVINLFTQKKTPIRNLCVLKNHLLMAWLGQQIQNYLDRLSAQECAA